MSKKILVLDHLEQLWGQFLFFQQNFEKNLQFTFLKVLTSFYKLEQGFLSMWCLTWLPYIRKRKTANIWKIANFLIVESLKHIFGPIRCWGHPILKKSKSFEICRNRAFWQWSSKYVEISFGLRFSPLNVATVRKMNFPVAQKCFVLEQKLSSVTP